MALWGNKDLVTSTGTIGIAYTNGLVTGTLTEFADDGVSEGDVINIGAGATYGFAVVESVTDNLELVVSTKDRYFVTEGADIPTGTTFAISQEPLYVMRDSTYAGPEERLTGFSTSPVTRVLYGVDQDEVSVASTTAYAVTHSGWVGITTYTDMHGNLRVKHEVIVAGSITGDADTDDTKFADS